MDPDKPQKVKNSISHSMVIWVQEPDAMLNEYTFGLNYDFGHKNLGPQSELQSISN